MARSSITITSGPSKPGPDTPPAARPRAARPGKPKAAPPLVETPIAEAPAAGAPVPEAAGAPAAAAPAPDVQRAAPAEAPKARTKGREPLLIDLALQGGGSHGAFTWGVLDRLLQEDWLKIEAISGTSAGAMNAAVLVDGHARGGAEGARAALERFWHTVSKGAAMSPFRRGPIDVLLNRWTLDHSIGYVAMDMMSRLFSPYDMPFGDANPLRDILAQCVDFGRLAASPIKLFVTATNVRTGRGRVFRNADLSPDALLASACLPTMFQAVEIDGEAYWDGGYSGNPTMTPLMEECVSDDTIIVGINPVERPGTPKSARDILNRLNEVSFNAVLLKELRMIALLRQVADPGNNATAHWANMRVHLVRSDLLTELGASSKLNAEWDFLTMLRDEGRRAAEEFLAAKGADLGQRSTLDIDQLLAGG